MKKLLVTLTLAFSALNAQDEFVRGIMMFTDVKANFDQFEDSLHLNWVQGLVDQSNGTKDTRAAPQHRWSRFLLDEGQKADTVIYQKDAIIRFYGRDIDKLRTLGILR